ncbi:hypothetical protein GTC33_002176 [Salmonella enterica]|nr:hypothetical protein [Salmonella enterica subsp. enterica serovar Hvittingfoss]EBP2487398.1 hypothetical protein [Salmonella enterica]ECD5667973.1 hypothetical protein [Salmonella enterica subsp. enterica serovar Hvittingfoss]EDS2449512.1 hypothetical protein [Salmonella enterica subsp. enterica serovar Hvittingfoss]EDT8068410.1 hypothetical protein [Salmonella enterica subsp. enterica serovar Hvittingfoss]
MTTITRFTKEQLRERAREKVKSLEFAVTQNAFADSRAELEEELELARIALASLTAEPVLYAAEETLAYANMGEIHLTCLSEPMGDAVIPLYTAPPAPVVPDEWTIQDAVKFCRETGRQDAGSAMEAWNACRAAMLQGVEQPQNARQNIPENIPDGNSPAIPDDWVMVPKEPTQAMIKAWLSEVANFRGHAAGYKAALAAAPQREVK